MSNPPLALVFAVNWLLPLPVNCRLAVAPGAAAPDGSTTVPVTLLATWAFRDATANKAAENSNTRRKRVIQPLSFGLEPPGRFFRSDTGEAWIPLQRAERRQPLQNCHSWTQA